MLQASEYNAYAYIRWLRRAKDFRTIEIRKKLEQTHKALFLLITGWVMFTALYMAAFISIVLFEVPYGPLLFILILGAAPYIVAYGILIPLFVIQICIQKPMTRARVKRAREKLRRHSAVKIGIAGSYGKTSMREILVTVLAEGKRVAAPEESINTPLGVCGFVESLTGNEEVLIFEMGEYYIGDIAYLCNIIQPDIGIITGINEAHLEKFGSLENTTRTIFELAVYLGNKPLYVNTENENVRKTAKSHHIPYNRNGVGNWKIQNPKTDLSGTSFDLVQEAMQISVTSKLLGLHQLGPLAAAADVALRIGIPIAVLAKGLNKTTAYDHRLEPKYNTDGIVTLDDSYNGNPDGVAAVIEFLSSLTPHRRLYVTPGLVEMGTRSVAVHKEIGKKLAHTGIEKVILIRNSVTPYIEEGLKENNFTGEILWYENAHMAFSALPVLTAKGDVVLLQNDWPDQYS